MVEKTEAACRQIFHRAKVQLAVNRPRFLASKEVHERILGSFLAAIQEGDLDKLKNLLMADASLWADGGGRIRGAATRPIYGAEAVAQFLFASTRFAPGEISPHVEEINGQPAIVLRSGSKPFVVVMLELQDDKIAVVRLLGNPQKLNGLKNED